MNTRMETVDALYADHPPGSRSASTAISPGMPLLVEATATTCTGLRRRDHRTYAWKPQSEIKRFEWESGDVIFNSPCTIPPSTSMPIPGRPARLISCNQPHLQEFRPQTTSS